MTATTTRLVQLGPVPIRFELEDREGFTAAPETVDVDGDTVRCAVQVDVGGQRTYARITGTVGEATLSFELPTGSSDIESVDQMLRVDGLFEHVDTVVGIEKAH